MRSFFFYDLETSGFSPRYDRIMQFAGQRTDMDLNPIGEPVNILIKLTDDILPSPGAILTTHITPQDTQLDGISEAEFCRYFLDEIARPDTIILGYNSTRFDDEFIRHTLWRNFHDPYEWAWTNGRSRWDLLDVVRMVRALRPDGINWPCKTVTNSETGETREISTVNLVDMARVNGFENQNAHDALADVTALINLARLIKQKQSKLWDHMLNNHSKQTVAKLVNLDNPSPFVYTSGRYSSDNEKTTIAVAIGRGRTDNTALVWDLRYSPTDYLNLTEQEMLSRLTADYETRRQPDFQAIPIKELSFNKCPAVAPRGTAKGAEDRIKLTISQATQNCTVLTKNPEFITKLNRAWHSKPAFPPASDVEGQLYDSFTPDTDKTNLRLIVAADEHDLASLHPQFTDSRLNKLLLRYKARNYPRSLTDDERQQWETYRTAKLTREIPKYMEELATLVQAGEDEFTLQELQLWAESIVPVDF